jgi:peptidoglycan/xylan/chitin deacetylase (PgdA/CDA1 family)
MILHKTPWWIKAFYRSLTWTGTPFADNRPVIYLTFDDGPIPEITPWVVDVLEQYDAQATFFCVGDNIIKHPEEYALVIANGHKTANHTYHHINGWKTPADTYYKEVQDCQQQLKSDGHTTPLFRPPYGKISRKQIEILSTEYQIIMWDVLSADYDTFLSPQKCLQASVKATEAGSIVVFHDSIKALKNLKYTLPAFLDHFADKGFVFHAL